MIAFNPETTKPSRVNRTLTTKPKYEIVAVNDIDVMVDVSLLAKSDGLYFNATDIAKQFGKKPIEWLDGKQAKEYIAVILKVENLHFENLIRTTAGGKYKGTWLHKKLALPFARWLSVEFEYNLDRVNRRRKRRWKLSTIADLIKSGLTDCYQLGDDLPAVTHLTVGFSSSFRTGVQSPLNTVVFLCQKISTAVMPSESFHNGVVRYGESYGSPHLFAVLLTLFNRAAQCLAANGGGYSILRTGFTA